MLIDSFECAPLYPYNLFFPSFFITTAWKLEQGRPPAARKSRGKSLPGRGAPFCSHHMHMHMHMHIRQAGSLFHVHRGARYAFCWLVSTPAWFFPT